MCSWIVIGKGGNKCDLIDKRVVTKEEAIAYAEQHHMGYIETSALASTNISEAFDIVIDGKSWCWVVS